MRLSYSREAQDDIESIYEYIAKEGGLAAADRVIDAISGMCEDLTLFPKMGRRRSELDDLGLEVRSIGERGYIIFYVPHLNVTHIVRVIHGARDYGPADLDGMTNIVA